MVRRGFNAPGAHGVGRYFDAFGSLLLDRPVSRYEGQIALELNMAADPKEKGRYNYDIAQGDTTWEIDLRPAVRDAVFESIGGEATSRISARVHNTLAAASVDVVRALSHRVGRLPVVLSGGCFQNARLAESIVASLEPEFRVYLHRRVPPGDGGIALGQAVVAAARAASERSERATQTERAGEARASERVGESEGRSPSVETGASDVSWCAGTNRRDPRQRSGRRLLRRLASRPPGTGGRAGSAGRLRAESRWVRDTAHPRG